MYKRVMIKVNKENKGTNKIINKLPKCGKKARKGQTERLRKKTKK